MRIIGFGICVCLLLISCNPKEEIEASNFYTDTLNSVEKINLEIEKIEKELIQKPNDFKLWLKKGNLCKEIADYPCALDAGAKTFLLDSQNIESRALFAWTLINKPNRELVDIENAKKHYKYIHSIKKNDDQVLVELANTFSLTGDFDMAFKLIDDALLINSKNRDAFVLRGSIYKIEGKLKSAMDSYQNAIQIDPDFFLGQLNIAWLLTEMENHELALEYYRNALDLDPKSVNALYGIAKSFQDLNSISEAHQAYRELIQVEPTFHYAYYNQGVMKQFLERELDSAVFYFDKSVQVQPEFVKGWHQLGEVYIEQDRRVDAARAFTKALELNPDFEPSREAVEYLKNL